jgi:MFS family permease
MSAVAVRDRVRGTLRREILAICAVAFIGDVIAGIVIPTFSLYAESLGASLVFVGALTTLSGLAQLVSSFPIGMLSDRVGRRRVLAFGLASFAAAVLLFASAPSPWSLVPGRLLLGVAMVSTFWIAAAHLGDIVTDDERGVAFGLLTTAMGIGFTIGPLLGGFLAEVGGTRLSYVAAALIGVVGVVVVLTQLPSGLPRHLVGAARRPSLRQSLRLAKNPNLVAAAIASALSSMAFAGAISTFFPLHAKDLGIPEATIGTLFAIRAGVSAVARLPAGILAGTVGNRPVLVGALVVEAVAVLGLAGTERTAVLAVLLGLEGVAFGAFLTSGQAFVAEHTVAATRGAAIGLYSTAGSIGGTVAPLGLGLVAHALGLPSVFVVTAALIVLGLGAFAWVSARAREDLSRRRTVEYSSGGEA